MAFLDQYGQPVSSTKPPQRNLATVTVRDRWSSYPSNGLTPERLARILREADEGDMLRQAELFDEMEEKDWHLASILGTRKLALSGLEWEIQPAGEDAADKKVAAAFAELWEELDTDELLLDLADAISKGISFVSLMWAAQAGGYTVSGSDWIHPKHWRYDFDQRRFQLMSDDAPGGELPPFGSVIEHRYKARSGSPTRAGVMRTCAWLYLFKNYAVKDWVAFAEVYGQPVRIGKYDPSTSKEEREALELAVSMIGSDAAGVISRDTEIQILEAGKRDSVDVYQTLVAMCEAGQSKAVLGQTLTSSEGQHGTQALGKVHDEVRQDLLRADAKAMAKTLRQQLVRPWTIFNYGAEYAVRVPKVVPQLSDPEDLEAASRVVVNLSGAGMKIPASWAREKFGIPEATKGEEVLASTPVLLQAERLEEASSEQGLRRKNARAQSWVDDLTRSSLAQGATATQRQIEAIAKAVQAATSFEELPDKLLELLPELSQEELAGVLQNALFMADLFGRSLES